MALCRSPWSSLQYSFESTDDKTWRICGHSTNLLGSWGRCGRLLFYFTVLTRRSSHRTLFKNSSQGTNSLLSKLQVLSGWLCSWLSSKILICYVCLITQKQNWTPCRSRNYLTDLTTDLYMYIWLSKAFIN